MNRLSAYKGSHNIDFLDAIRFNLVRIFSEDDKFRQLAGLDRSLLFFFERCAGAVDRAHPQGLVHADALVGCLLGCIGVTCLCSTGYRIGPRSSNSQSGLWGEKLGAMTRLNCVVFRQARGALELYRPDGWVTVKTGRMDNTPAYAMEGDLFDAGKEKIP